jgi:hypothetical protein
LVVDTLHWQCIFLSLRSKRFSIMDPAKGILGPKCFRISPRLDLLSYVPFYLMFANNCFANHRVQRVVG